MDAAEYALSRGFKLGDIAKEINKDRRTLGSWYRTHFELFDLILDGYEYRQVKQQARDLSQRLTQ